jgi:hypothetical protein
MKVKKKRINAGNKAFYGNKKYFNVDYYLNARNLDYTGRQSDQLLHEAHVLNATVVHKLMRF